MNQGDICASTDYILMEQNKDSRNRPIHIWPFDIWLMRQGYSKGNGASSQQIILDQLDLFVGEKWTSTLTTQHSQIFIQNGLQCETLKLVE